MVEPADEDLKQEVKRLKEDLVQTRRELKEVQRELRPRKSGRRPIEEVTCYGYGVKGHYRRSCPHNQEAGQEKQGPAAGPAVTPVSRKSQSQVGQLLIKEDALYVTGEVGECRVGMVA